MSCAWRVAALCRKDLKVALSYRLGFVVAVFGGLWGLLGFRVLSKIVTAGQFHSSSTAYFDFAVIGAMLTFVLEPAATAGAAAARADQVQGTLEYLAAMPVPRWVLGLGWSAYSVVQSAVVAAVVVALTSLLGFRIAALDLPAAAIAIVLALAVFLALGNLASAVVVRFQQGGGVMAVVVGACALLGGALYPVRELPAAVRPLSALSPMTYAFEAVRASLLHGQPPARVGHDLVVLAVMAAVLVPLSVACLTWSFAGAQRRGTLASF